MVQQKQLVQSEVTPCCNFLHHKYCMNCIINALICGCEYYVNAFPMHTWDDDAQPTTRLNYIYNGIGEAQTLELLHNS